jgi:methyl-accepting chemotaxis protein
LKKAVELIEELKKRREELKEIILSSEKMTEVSERVASLMEERKAIEKKMNLLDELVESFAKFRANFEKLENRMLSLEEFRKRVVTKEEISGLKEEMSKKILELDKLSDEVRSKIETWNKKMEDIFEGTKVAIEFSRKVKSMEESIKKIDKRQKELIKLLEAAI